MNTARSSLAGCGTQTLALAFGGGNPSATGATELYNGTTWSTSPATLGTSRSSLAGAGTQTAALGFGGSAYLTATEEFTGAFLSVKKITTS